MLDPKIREDFPTLSELTYLNTASVGLVPAPVIRELRNFDDDLLARGTTGFDEVQEIAVLDAARTGAASLVDCVADDIAIISSFTEALNQVAWWVRPSRNQNIVTTDAEFPSVTYPWIRVAQETGAEVRFAPLIDNLASFHLEQLTELVDNATSVVCISHVQYLTGRRHDLTALAEAAHRNGALLVVDATQSAGQVPISVKESSVDVLIAGGYKWLCAPFGAAFCYLNPKSLEKFDPPFVGWRSMADPYDLDARWREYAAGAARLEYSTMSYSSAVGLGSSLKYILDIGVDEIFDHNFELTERLMGGLRELGSEVLSPATREERSGSVTVRFPGRASQDLVRGLASNDVIVSPRRDAARFSMHYYNNADDVDAALSVLASIL